MLALSWARSTLAAAAADRRGGTRAAAWRKLFQHCGSSVRRRPPHSRLSRQIGDRKTAIRNPRPTGNQPRHGFPQGCLGAGADRFHGFDCSNGAISRSLRSCSATSVERWSGDSRGSRNISSVSSIDFCQAGRCRAPMQEFGQRSGLQRDSTGTLRSFVTALCRQMAFDGSKKQSLTNPPCRVRAIWRSDTQRTDGAVQRAAAYYGRPVCKREFTSEGSAHGP